MANDIVEASQAKWRSARFCEVEAGVRVLPINFVPVPLPWRAGEAPNCQRNVRGPVRIREEQGTHNKNIQPEPHKPKLDHNLNEPEMLERLENVLL